MRHPFPLRPPDGTSVTERQRRLRKVSESVAWTTTDAASCTVPAAGPVSRVVHTISGN
jgi:hypothetical protein